MVFFDWFKKKKESSKQDQEEQHEPEKKQPESSYGYGGYGHGQWYPTKSRYYDGEKTLGELGLVIDNIVDHRRLRMRAYDAYLKTEIGKIISNRFFQNVVGNGLKLQAEPNAFILQNQGINLPEDFVKTVESRFSLWANSTISDYSGMITLHKTAWLLYKTAYIGGDCLVVTRFEKSGITVQLIDGQHISSPLLETTKMRDIEDNGNFIENGVEFDSRGKHIAYHVSVKKPGKIINEYERIEAFNENGLQVAWLLYGDLFRLDHKRGITKLANSLEKINKIDRYSEAAVGKAEQAANVFMAIEHDASSTGEDPFTERFSRKLGSDTEKNLDSFAIGDDKARVIRESTSNMAVNLPPGAKLSSFSTAIESNYSDFYKTNFDTVSASSDLPPEVALQSYNSNYSASKAALDNWQSIINFHNSEFANDFYKKIYKLWLINEILSNKIQAPGFLDAFNLNDYMVLEAYYNCRFTGYRIPHIDPQKEVRAVRSMLGEDKTPLTSLEAAAERLNLGDYKENIERFKRDKEIAPESEGETNNQNNNNNS